MTAANEVISPMDQRVISLIRKRGPISCQDLAKSLDMNQFVLHGWLKTLVDEKRIVRTTESLFLVPTHDNEPTGGSAA